MDGAETFGIISPSGGFHTWFLSVGSLLATDECSLRNTDICLKTYYFLPLFDTELANSIFAFPFGIFNSSCCSLNLRRSCYDRLPAHLVLAVVFGRGIWDRIEQTHFHNGQTREDWTDALYRTARVKIILVSVSSCRLSYYRLHAQFSSSNFESGTEENSIVLFEEAS